MRDIWNGEHKIPWNEPGFSRRMLAEHLTQKHDMASRRFEWIDRQVGWIHKNLLCGRHRRILDLGCGPGLYLHRLVKRGHVCYGIDFSPASIEYASLHNPDKENCRFTLGDIRKTDFGNHYGLAMMLFGEFNTFSPDEAAAILRKTYDSLNNSAEGMLLEISTPQAVERIGCENHIHQETQNGLFSDGPYTCDIDNKWVAERKIAVQTFTVTEKLTGKTSVYRSTTLAWAPEELASLVKTAGFTCIKRLTDWPCNTDDLQLWLVEK